MAKDNRSSVAVGRDTAAALKGIADAVGATVGLGGHPNPAINGHLKTGHLG